MIVEAVIGGVTLLVLGSMKFARSMIEYTDKREVVLENMRLEAERDDEQKRLDMEAKHEAQLQKQELEHQAKLTQAKLEEEERERDAKLPENQRFIIKHFQKQLAFLLKRHDQLQRDLNDAHLRSNFSLVHFYKDELKAVNAEIEEVNAKQEFR